MYFDQKLRGLMQLFKISNSKLARGINVDASLVSRWKSGERAISETSPHVPAIASYFLKLNAYHYQKEFLDYILKSRLPENLSNDMGRRIHALADWLISDEPPEFSTKPEKPHSPAITKNIIASIAGLMSGHNSNVLPKEAATASNLNLSETVSGFSSRYERFEGMAGRRQAVLGFLLDIAESETRHDLLLTSEDDMGWLTGDRQFTIIWASLLKQIIESGHSITIIHVVNRQREEIINALSYWMPLHLAGSLKSYYFPRYTEQPVKQTLFISRGHSAVAAWSTQDSEIQQTFVYHEAETVRLFESIFETHLSQCKPLFSVYTRKNCTALLETGLVLRKKPGNMFNIRNNLNSLLIDQAMLGSLEEEDSNTGMNPEIVSQLSDHRQVFLENLANEEYYDIIPLGLLDKIQRTGQSEVDSCLMCLNRPLVMNAMQTEALLQSMIDTLKSYDHYNVYLSEHVPGLEDVNVNITFKEDSFALFSPGSRQKKESVSIMLREANILRSLSYYFDDYIQHIPTVQRQKQDVIFRLEKTINYLKTHY